MLLGMWIAGSLFMMAVAIGNFQGVDRLVQSPQVAVKPYVETLGADAARVLLRHQVSELNRHYFSVWESVQVALGIAVMATLWYGTSGDRLYLAGSLLLLLLVGVEHWLITPELTSLGRIVDFTSADTPIPEQASFWRLHNAYSALEVVKLALIGGISVRLLVFRSHRRSQVRKKVDAVDHANYG